MTDRPSPERIAEIRAWVADPSALCPRRSGVLDELVAEIDALKAELAEYHRRDAEDAEMAAAMDRAEAEADRLEKERQERRDRENAEELYAASLRPDE
jgi:transposase